MANNKFQKGGSSLANLKQNINNPTENKIATSLGDEILELDPSIIKVSRYQREYELDENVDDLLESFPLTGQLEYAIARRLEDGSIELIAGHRRRLACLRLGIKLKTIIKNYENELQAELDYLESNKFREIDELTKAMMFNRQIEIVRGLREKGLIKGKATAIVAKQLGISEKTVQRTASLDRLIPEFKTLFNTKDIAKGIAYELSLLDENSQKTILENFKDISKITASEVQKVKTNEEAFTQEEKIQLVNELSTKSELINQMTEQVKKLEDTNSENADNVEKVKTHYQNLIDEMKTESSVEKLKELQSEIDVLQVDLKKAKNKNDEELSQAIEIKNNTFILKNILNNTSNTLSRSLIDLSFDKESIEMSYPVSTKIDYVILELEKMIDKLKAFK